MPIHTFEKRNIFQRLPNSYIDLKYYFVLFFFKKENTTSYYRWYVYGFTTIAVNRNLLFWGGVFYYAYIDNI